MHGGDRIINNSQDDPMETFCYMMIEEFLMRKGMESSLQEFRTEWKRPSDEMSMLTWYDVCMKLQITDILESAPEKATVLENLALTLTKETSIRMRKPIDVTINGLATLPKKKPVIGSKQFHETEKLREQALLNSRQTSGNNTLSGDSVASLSSSKRSDKYQKSSRNTDYGGREFIASKLENSIPKFESMIKSGKPSSENWIPEIERMKSLGRDLAVAKDNLGDIIKRETQSEREMRQFKKSVLDKAKIEEELGSKKKMACGCCYLMFSYPNLPLRVSNKAVVDLRQNWSGGKRGWWSAREDKLGSMPRCYNDILVCTFCAQFFFDSDAYRPSFDKLREDERAKARLEHQRLMLERQDPVKMVEKDRAAHDKQMELAQEEEKKSIASLGSKSLSTL